METRGCEVCSAEARKAKALEVHGEFLAAIAELVADRSDQVIRLASKLRAGEERAREVDLRRWLSAPWIPGVTMSFCRRGVPAELMKRSEKR